MNIKEWMWTVFFSKDIKFIEFGYRNPEDINIKDLKIKFPLPYCVFSLRCSKGTYIRQLAEDFGKKLNQFSTLIELERISIGSWNKEHAITISEFEKILKTKLNSE
jgi:tRNA pseudouridine55 synthase